MSRPKSFLTTQEIDDLVQFVAATGENYPRYVDWCNDRGLPPEKRYTPAYFHQWVNRKKPSVKSAKAEHQVAVRQAAVMHKSARVEMLQAAAKRLTLEIDRLQDAHECEECGCHIGRTTELILKVEEQLRKTMESIAKEMGEFNKPADVQPSQAPLDAKMAALVHQYMKPAQPLIEGVATPVGVSP